MFRSLRVRLFAWNALFFVLALIVFGGLQVITAARTAEQMLDAGLIERARDVGRGPRAPRGQGLNPPEGIAPFGPNGQAPRNSPPPRPNEGIERAQFQGEQPRPNRPPVPEIPFRRPYMEDEAGNPIGPGRGASPWSPKMLAKARSERKLVKGYIEADGTRLRVVTVPLRRLDGTTEIVQVAQEADGLRIAVEAQIRSLAMALPFVLLAALGLAWLLSRIVLKPIAAVTETAEKLASDVTASDRISVESNDELGRLSTAFNSMADHMQEAHRGLADALDRQRRFSSDAAHEFRTPLTSIALATENGLHEQATPDEMKKSLTVVDRSVKSLARLTELLLSISRFDAGKERLSLNQISPAKVVAEVIDELQAAEKVQSSVPAEIQVRANEGGLHQILKNLLANALAYTPEGTDIEVAMKGSVLSVADKGPGIAQEHLPRLFDRFYRVDASRTRSQGGHGLGLSIAQQMAEAMGARLSVQSELGKGTTFFIHFEDVAQPSQNPHL
jgi:signal transduction histidine kinase